MAKTNEKPEPKKLGLQFVQVSFGYWAIKMFSRVTQYEEKKTAYDLMHSYHSFLKEKSVELTEQNIDKLKLGELLLEQFPEVTKVELMDSRMSGIIVTRG